MKDKMRFMSFYDFENNPNKFIIDCLFLLSLFGTIGFIIKNDFLTY